MGASELVRVIKIALTVNRFDAMKEKKFDQSTDRGSSPMATYIGVFNITGQPLDTFARLDGWAKVG